MNALAKRGGIDEVLWKGGTGNLLSLEIEFTTPAPPNNNFRYRIELVSGATGFVNIQNEQLTVTDDQKERHLVSLDSDGRWLLGPNSERLVSVQAQRSVMELAPPNWEGHPLKWFAQNWRYYQLVPSLMKQINQVTAGGVLDTHGQNLSAWLMWLQTRSPESFERIAEAVHDVFPEISRLMTWPTQQGTVYLSSKEEALSRPTPLFQMSDGELIFIAFLSLICAPDELSRTLFLIEDPENHLHPKLLEILFSLLRQVRQEVADRNGPPSQIILTTHSPYVLDQMNLEEVIWVGKKNGETVPVRPSEKSHLRRLVEDGDLGISDLMFTGALGDE